MRKTFLAIKDTDTPTEETTNDVVKVAEVVEDDTSPSPPFSPPPPHTTPAPLTPRK